jgi:hypothetical protein
MKTIIKKVKLNLTQEEVNSPEEIKIILDVKVKDTDKSVSFTISYPKEKLSHELV